MSQPKVHLPELPFYDVNENEHRKPTVRKRNERSHDSEGKFTIEPAFPTHEQFVQTETRREMSVAYILRMKDEEIIRLRHEIKMLKQNG